MRLVIICRVASACAMAVTPLTRLSDFRCIPDKSAVLFHGIGASCAAALVHFEALSDEPRAAPCFSVKLGCDDEALQIARAMRVNKVPAVAVISASGTVVREGCSGRSLECAVRGSAL